jgi:hypothetical protein
MSLETSFTRLLTERELRQCNRLLSAALIDKNVEERLIHHQDTTLFKLYGLPDDVVQWLQSAPRQSIPELAELICNWQSRPNQ